MKTGGASPAESNRFVYAFLDDFSGWKYFPCPLLISRSAPTTTRAPRWVIPPCWTGGATRCCFRRGAGLLLRAQVATYGGVGSLRVAFAESLYLVTEAAPPTITVALNMPAALPVTVVYATSDGTADSQDYPAASGTL